MSEQQSTPATTHPVVMTQEIINTKFNAELTKFKYQEALQRFMDFQVTEENTAQLQESIKKVRAFARQIDKIKTDGKAPSLAEGRMWDAAYNSIIKPLEKAIADKSSELQKMIDKIAEENRKREQEKLRVDGIKKDIDNFILAQSTAIANATTDKELVTIEKIIGSHKGNKSRYQEFLELFVERVNELTPLIKTQKESIRKMKELKLAEEEAKKTEDDKKLLEIQEQKEHIQHSIEETKVTVQHTAINQAIRPDETIEATVVPTAIKYRRTSWKWEVTDIAALFKKAPHLVQLVPNEEKIKELLDSKKADGSLKDVEEVVSIPGLRFYLEKLA